MARITRHSFSCPHCRHEIAASWGDASYVGLPDAFACPRCRQTVALSPEQRLSKAADQEKLKGVWRVFLGILASMAGVAFLIIRVMKMHISGSGWAILIGGIVMSTMFIFVIVQAIRRDRAYNRFKAQIMPK